MFRVRAVAEMYDVSVSTIYRAIEAGHLAAFRIGAGKGAVRIPEDALAAFENSCGLPPTAAQTDTEQPGDVA
ncbi:MAG: helix-turn-helix domain-containing protein [Actinophytocola sp.]|nr:helix-turn-helix domain-containing protein [Actinophytocola sp.]